MFQLKFTNTTCNSYDKHIDLIIPNQMVVKRRESEIKVKLWHSIQEGQKSIFDLIRSTDNYLGFLGSIKGEHMILYLVSFPAKIDITRKITSDYQLGTRCGPYEQIYLKNQLSFYLQTLYTTNKSMQPYQLWWYQYFLNEHIQKEKHLLKQCVQK